MPDVAARVSAADQMARDTALIEAVSVPGGSVRAVRAYTWDGPAVTLGRSNRVESLDLTPLREAGIEVVRRPTGGGALVHGTDVSFAVAIRRPRGGGGDLIAEGRALAEPVREALREMGFAVEFRDCTECDPERSGGGPGPVPACFLQRSPYDLLAGRLKVGAFALRRTRAALFLHGSVLVEPVPAAVAAAVRASGIGGGAAWDAATTALSRLPGARGGLAEQLLGLLNGEK